MSEPVYDVNGNLLPKPGAFAARLYAEGGVDRVDANGRHYIARPDPMRSLVAGAEIGNANLNPGPPTHWERQWRFDGGLLLGELFDAGWEKCQLWQAETPRVRSNRAVEQTLRMVLLTAMREEDRLAILGFEIRRAPSDNWCLARSVVCPNRVGDVVMLRVMSRGRELADAWAFKRASLGGYSVNGNPLHAYAGLNARHTWAEWTSQPVELP